MSSTKQPMEARLPVTPCSADMRAQMYEAAKKLGISLAEAQRRAFSLFLSKTDTNSIGQSNIMEQ